MHLRYYTGTDGLRVYTLSQVDPDGKPTVFAHPARFSPDDKFSRHRYILKGRYGLLPTQEHSNAAIDDPATRQQEQDAGTSDEMQGPKHIFFTHFNGTWTFKVEIILGSLQKFVLIYPATYWTNKSTGEADEANFATEPSLTMRLPLSNKIFIGRSFEYRGILGSFYDGNSILVHRDTISSVSGGEDQEKGRPSKDLAVPGERYVYVNIGREVFEFSTTSRVVSYHSPVRNSQVPYPYAVDEQSRVYLTVDDVSFPLAEDSVYAESVKADKEDPYQWYYKHKSITHGIFGDPPVKNFQQIKEFWAGKHVYSLSWAGERHCLEQLRNYQTRELPRHKQADKERAKGIAVSVVLVDGSRKQLTEDDFAQLMRDYGQTFGMRELADKTSLLDYPFRA